MIVAGQRLPILIATKPVDFRCGHNALALIVQTELKLDPHSRRRCNWMPRAPRRRFGRGARRLSPGQ